LLRSRPTVIVAAVNDEQSEAPRPRPRRRRARVVALTGVHGVAGAALVRRLEADERTRRLILVDRHAPALPLRDTVFHGVDLTATLADVALAEILRRERVETVIHAAFHDVPRRNLEAAHELEVLGTRALFRAIADNARCAGEVSNVVVLGSTLSYGARADNPQYLDEDAPLRGDAGYPFVADKLAVEEEVASLRVRTGLPVAMLRLAPTVGDERTLLARLLAPAVVPAVIGTDPLVQLLDVDDLVEAVRLAAHGRADGSCNVAGEGVLPLSTLIKLSGRLRAAVPESALRMALQGLWVVGAGLVPGAHVAYLRDTFVADTTRMVERLGFRSRYAIRDALARHVSLRRRGVPAAA
jgi:UDP-glucose 4-epimerase